MRSDCESRPGYPHGEPLGALNIVTTSLHIEINGPLIIQRNKLNLFNKLKDLKIYVCTITFGFVPIVSREMWFYLLVRLVYKQIEKYIWE